MPEFNFGSNIRIDGATDKVCGTFVDYFVRIMARIKLHLLKGNLEIQLRIWILVLLGYSRFCMQLLDGFRLASEQSIAADRERDLAPYLDLHARLRVLDLANGRLRPQYSLLQAQGYHAFGIDLANQLNAGLEHVAYRVLRWLYRARIKELSKRLDCDGLVCGDVGKLPFSDESFDLATSVAAFEHFLNVPAVVAELKRVIQPGGMVWVCIHLFTAPSGGHNLGFVEIPLRHLPRGVEPWDHLRKRRLPFNVPLNEWRLHQYRAEFTRHFEIVKEYCATREGEHLLTPELRAELSGYDTHELTSAAYVFVARKKNSEQRE